MKKRRVWGGPLGHGPRKHRYSLSMAFSVAVALILLAAIGTAAVTAWLLVYLGVIGDESALGAGEVILYIFLFSVVTGSAAAFFSSRIPLKPVNTLINKMNELAAGNFKTRLDFGDGAFGSHATVREVSDSFNKMAEELEKTEMLRGDFINNFSHEFKTPIVSITGLAKLLRRGNLTEEQRAQYLAAIEEESLRLSRMATNVLNLTKVENQTILADLTPCQISEQIRSAVLLLESKWEAKRQELQLDFDEYTVEANEELLKQVWINLLDNAVKFCPPYGTVFVEIAAEGETLRVTVGNTGSEIPPDQYDKIFRKFYQGDESHGGEGNGVGLAIVRRIVELHKGTVTVKSGNGVTRFAVTLPVKQ